MTETYVPKVWRGSVAASELQVENKPKGYADVRRSRPNHVARENTLVTGVISGAKGSAYYESENTKLVAAVFGPKQSSRSEYSEQGVLTCNFSFAPFALEQVRKGGRMDNEEVQIASALQEALGVCIQLHKFPKHEVEVNVIVLERGGGELSAAITCAALALADSGIEMFDLVGASTVVYVKGMGVVLDPSLQEIEHPDCEAVVNLAYMPTLQQVTYLRQLGRVPPPASILSKLLAAAQYGAIECVEQQRKCIAAALAVEATSGALTTAGAVAMSKELAKLAEALAAMEDQQEQKEQSSQSSMKRESTVDDEEAEGKMTTNPSSKKQSTLKASKPSKGAQKNK